YVICWAIAAATATIAVRRRRRTMLHAGMAMLALSFVTNKPYFGLARKSWDPILFGLLVAGVGAIAYRLLNDADRRSRSRITTDNALKPRSYGFDLASVGVAIAGPMQAPSAGQQAFGGGRSGGGGAQGSF